MTALDLNGPEKNGDKLAGIPAWGRFLVIVGPTAGIALFLVYVGAKELPEIRRIVTLHQEAINAHALATARQADEQHQRNIEMYRLLQRICVNTANTPLERARCFDP